MDEPLRPPLPGLAARQYGLFTFEQALTVYTRGEVRSRVGSGRWCRVVRGAYARRTVRIDPATRLAAVRLVTGSEVTGCLHTAAALHRFGVVDDDVVHLIRPGLPSVRSGPDVRVHRVSLDPSDVELVDGLRVTSAARTAADLARVLPRPDGLAVLDAALTVTDRGAVRTVLDRGAGLRGVRNARALLELADVGAESPMESRLRLCVLDAGLPRPSTQYWVDGCRLDLAWPCCRVGAEYDGAVHDARAAIRADRARHNRLRELGWEVFVFTDVDVYRRPERVAALLRHALAARVGLAP
jgi:very-short-patch-repair endonuclease